MRILITTSDDYVHLLPGFAHQWTKYADSVPFTVVYRNVAPPPLPAFVTTLASPADHKDWSTMVYNAVERISDRILLVGLEDFWLSDLVDWDAVHSAKEYMIGHPDVLRIDLTEDRMAFPYVERDDYYQAVVNPNELQYLISTQWSIWRRDELLKWLKPGETSPQFEVEGSKRIAPTFPTILGTGFRPLPGSGDGIIHNGRLDNPRTEYLYAADVDELKELGYL